MLWLVRIVGVIALLVAASVLSTPKGRLPLALRGLKRTLEQNGAATARAPSPRTDIAPPSAKRRFVAFLLVLLSILIAAL